MKSVKSTLFALFAASSAVYADSAINLTPGVSPISRDVYQLHMTVFWICVVIGVIVFGAMLYSIIYHRKSRGAVPAEFHSHPFLEIGWTIVPVIILVLMAIPATKVLFNMNNNDQEELTIKITGYQWKWHYEYLEDQISFFSNLSTSPNQMRNVEPKGEFYLREVDNEVVVPIHKKIRFLITSNDVNHAWWIPDFGVKRDAIAGFINEAWTIINKPGTYRGQCAELCGINHAFMPIVVRAVPEADYEAWVAQQKGQASAGDADIVRKWSMQELMTQGEKVYGRICAACHQPGGTGLPPTFPALKGSKVTTGPIDKHVEIVMNGISGSAMQAFKSQLSDVDIASVITYERNAWGNNTNTSVQPIQMKAYRDGKTMADALATQPDATATAAAIPGKKAQATPPAVAVPTGGKTPVKAIPTTTGTEPANTGAKPLSPEDALKEAMARGEKVYLSTCGVCHQPGGTGMPPTFPALKGSKIATGPLAAHLNIVLHGKAGTAMQAFKDQLKDQDLADVITYERNAWGNNTKTLVSLEQINAARLNQDHN